MFAQIDTRNPHDVENQVRWIHRQLFPDSSDDFVPRVFGWASQCFTGCYQDYLAIDARYHDFEHTLQGTLCLARLLHGRHQAGIKPAVSRDLFELALVAILFHDTGYLKRADDREGTGAKYTLTHVVRSAEFAGQFLAGQGYSPEDASAVRHMIGCTGLNANLHSIPFRNDLERMLGCALATADLLGQMAAPDYVEKLPILYLEFAEAVQHDRRNAGRLAAYESPEDLARRTPSFWQNYVLPKIEHDFGRLHRFLNDPYPDGPNPYLDRIRQNVERIRAANPAPGF